jgi:hypothetical protein
MRKHGDLDQVAFLAQLNLLRGDPLNAVAERLSRCPPLAGELDAMRRHATALWRRFTTYLPRHLARLAGVTGKRMKAELPIRYVKVAEYQARGVIHFHAVIRLDARTKQGFTPPPARYNAALLCDAIALAAKAVRITVPGSGPGYPARLRLRTRHAARLAAAVRRDRPRAGSRRGRELHRQVRHQGRRCPRLARYPHPARRRNRRAPLRGPPQAHGRHGGGTSAHGPRSVIRGSGCGRTSSGSAAIRSPNPAATP